MIKAIIFDWGGVLSEDNNREAAKKLSKEYPVDEEELAKTLASEEEKYSSGEDAEKYYQDMSKKFSIPTNILKKRLNEVKPWETFAFAEKLSKKYKIFVLSNQMTPRTQSIKKNNDLGFFEKTFFSDELKMQKPDPKIFKHVLKEIGFQGEECIFIDDKTKHLRSAKKLGIKTILYENVEQLKKELKKISVKEN